MKTKTVVENGFKESEIGLIPEDWELTSLEKVTNRLKAGGTPSTGIKEYWNGEIPLVKVEDVVKSDKYLTQTKLNITKKGLDNSNTYLLPKGSLLLTMYGTAGEVAINTVPAAPTQNVLGIIPNEEVSKEFLYYALKFSKTKALELIVDKTIFKHFTLAKSKRLLMPKPPLPEQQKISHILSKIQQAIEQQDKIIQTTKELKKSMMNKLFTEGLHGEEQKETEIGLLPRSWKVISMGDLLNKNILLIQNGFPCGNWNDRGEGIPHLRPFNVTEEGYIDIQNLKYVQTQNKIDQYILKRGDIIFNNTNSEELVGKTAIWQSEGIFVLSNHMTIIRILDQSYIIPLYLARLLHKKWFDKFYLGLCRRHVNQASVGVERIKGIKLGLPSREEQQEIANILSNVDKKIQQAEARKQSLQALFKTMLNQLMTGRIKVKDLDVEVKENV
jgi:type I restriction enzyme S subunit